MSPAPELPELDDIEHAIEAFGRHAKRERLAEVRAGGRLLPVDAIVVGAEDRALPTVALVGGVHGLERIGTQIVVAYMRTLAAFLDWDPLTARDLVHQRIAFVPLLNPSGMLLRRRSNARGVDLMRNAPDRGGEPTTPLVGGQRLSPRLPWYRGRPAEPMEAEARALLGFIERELFGARASLALDVHSGFGMSDRIWFPYARTRRPFPELAEVFALHRLLDRTLPNNVYRFEPQALNYTVDGDLWDHLHDRHAELPRAGRFIPLTLELGSWRWIKKNPLQLFDALGSFNPVKPHRLRRALRGHLVLFDFLRRAVSALDEWRSWSEEERRAIAARAFEHWYAR
jgi:hypothetical protein